MNLIAPLNFIVPMNFIMNAKWTAVAPVLALTTILASQNVPEHNNWRITIQPDTPRAIVVQTRGSAPRTVWALTFTIKNETGAAHTLSPYVFMTTDTNKNISASYDPAAMETLKAYTDEKLTDLYDLAGGIEDGGTKRCVAIFDNVDVFANHYTYHFAGFGSSLWRKGGEFTQQAVEFRSTFARAGNEFQVCSAPVKSEGSEWVTLGSKKIR